MLDQSETIHQVRALEPTVAGQDVVGQLGRRRHDVLVHDDQILVHHGPVDELHVGEAHQRVVAEREERLDRIRLAVGHGAKDGGGLAM